MPRGSTLRSYIVGGGRAVDGVFAAVVAVVLFAMMLAIVADAAGRLIGRPIVGVMELVEEYGMVMIVFLALGFTHRGGHHIVVEIFVNQWSALRTRAAHIVVDLIGAAYCGYIAYASLLNAAHAWRIGLRSSSALAYPLVPVHAIVFIGSAILCIWLLVDVVLGRLVVGRDRGE